MDQGQILKRLEAHDKQKTNIEAIMWRKCLDKKLTQKQVREKSMEFFGNKTLSSNHTTVEKAIKSIETVHKRFKLDLKLKIAHEEYQKYKEEPKKDVNRVTKLKVPPESYKSSHLFRNDSDLLKFKCEKCHKEFNTKENATKHMEDYKLRTDDWLESLDLKVKEDKRLADFYGSPAVIKHLTVETNLPNPDMDDEDLNDVTLATEDNHHVDAHRDVLVPFMLKTPKQNVRQIIQEQSQKMIIARQKSKEKNEKNKERQVRFEVKKRLIHEKEINKENMEIVETDGNILTVRKTKVIVEENTGRKRTQTTMKTFVDVTTKNPRKRKSNIETDRDCSKLTPEALRMRSQKLAETAKALTSTKEEEAIVTAKALDFQTKDGEFEQTFKNKSKTFKERIKLTVEEAADEHIATHTTRRGLRRKRTVLNKFGKNIYPSEKKLMKELERRTNIKNDDYNKETKLIHKNKQGDKKAEVKETEVTIVKDLVKFVSKVVEAESNFLENVAKIEGAVSVDAGGKRVVSEFTILNRNDNKVKPHIIVLFEGTDNYHNLNVTVGTLRDQIKQLNKSKIKVNDKFVEFNMKTIVDGSALSTLMGKQGASATALCTWTNVTLEHLRNHKKKNHTPTNCPEIKYLTKDDYRENLLNNAVEVSKRGKQQGREAYKTKGKHHGNVIGNPIIDLEDPLENVPAWMHISMGLTNDTLEEFDKEVKQEDEKTKDEDCVDENKVKKLKELEDDLNDFKEEYEEQFIAASMTLSDKRRLQFIRLNNESKAEEEANKSYTIKTKKRKKNIVMHQSV